MPTIKDRVQKKSGRYYDVNGTMMPSVTTILGSIAKPALVNWAATVEREMVSAVSADLYLHTVDMNAPLTRESWMEKLNLSLGQMKASQKQLQKAGEIGSTVHRSIETEIERRMGVSTEVVVPTSKEAGLAYKAWLDWADTVELKPIASEQVVWSTTYGFAGTLDLLAEVNGELAVLDWKTGRHVYPESHLQSAAYRWAVREMGHGNPTRGYIVRLPKVEGDGFEVVEAADEKESLEVFLHAKRVWEWLQAEEAKYEARLK